VLRRGKQFEIVVGNDITSVGFRLPLNNSLEVQAAV
jgi:hypothetical protein